MWFVKLNLVKYAISNYLEKKNYWVWDDWNDLRRWIWGCGLQLQVKTVMVEGKDKGAAIVEEAKQQKVSLLVIGQRKRPRFWCLMKRWVRNRGKGRSDVVEYCIQNAACMTIAVRRKNKKLGGFLITTKRHKNFWLLA